ncbi:hypothetical protein AWB71_04161 [Caballeronia peredens]|nr:hypothetical protein AWB71_04161 [Caballeronia peredens]
MSCTASVRPDMSGETSMSTRLIVSFPNRANFQFDAAKRKFLAQGDSWFSIGALPPALTTNILANIALDDGSGAVTFASPGKTLQQMIDWKSEAGYVSVLCGGKASRWDALLFSAGGNDLFDAILTMPGEADPKKASMRLLRTVAERAAVQPSADCSHYIRPEGWSAFLAVMTDCIVQIVAKRDDPHSQSQGVPIVFHSYDIAQPREAPVVAGKIGPWLFKAFTDPSYAIPQGDWLDVVKYLLGSWAAFFVGAPGQPDINARLAAQGVASANIRFANLVGTLTPANRDSKGPDGDWTNEIHPSIQGYKRLGRAYSSAIPAAPETFTVAQVPTGATG